MEIGKRLRNARLEQGLSQKELAGDTVTRNMLSQIENGSARPSMATLQILAARLGKTVGYFLDEETASENQGIIRKVRSAAPEEVLMLLEHYQSPDDVFDAERYLAEALACLALAKQAIADDKKEYARSLLLRGLEAGKQTIYFTEDLQRRFCLVRFQCDTASAAMLETQLPDFQPELLLRAHNAMERSAFALAGSLLDCCTTHDTPWCLMRGRAYLSEGEFSKAAQVLELTGSPLAYGLLEECYRGLEDYKKAYEYACKQRAATDRPAH